MEKKNKKATATTTVTRKKVLKLAVIIAAFAVLAKAKYAKCKTDEQIAGVRAFMALRPIVEKYEQDRKEAHERLKPENFAELEEQTQRWDELTGAEKAENNRQAAIYNDKVNKFIEAELDREIEVETCTMNEESLGRLMASNPDWTMGETAAVIEIFS